MIVMKLDDAKFILSDLLELSIANDIIKNLTEQDILNTSVISLQKDEIKLLNDKFNNQLSITENLNKILANKDKEISYLNDTIKQQKNEILKQKLLKYLGFTAAIVLPITILLLH